MEGTEQEREDGECCGEHGVMHVAGKDEGSKPGAGPGHSSLTFPWQQLLAHMSKSVTPGTAKVSHGAMNTFPAPPIPCSMLPNKSGQARESCRGKAGEGDCHGSKQGSQCC